MDLIMPDRFPASTRVPHLLHGGDYNPEQWIDSPEVWDQDMRLMKLAGVNIVSLGIFSWAMLEPEEGRFEFGWMDTILDKLAANGIAVNLATPTGAKPNWMAAKYEEIRRCEPNGRRDPQQARHNHCYTSPVYRAKATLINTKLAERYGKHPALVMWHISNEYGGECHCPLCKAAFRRWLQNRYASLDALNHAWWTTFWSHRYTDWSQIEAIDSGVHGLVLDWKRFVSDQTADFMRHEIEPLKRITPEVPVTTNLMGTYPVLNYWKLAEVCDVVSWDSYPEWHVGDLFDMAHGPAFAHDLTRSLKHKPFLLMESTPSQVNWNKVSPLKRPGVHRLTSLQAVAHGSDAVMYFQWRKSRGSYEKFHGAVVDHVGHENTRVFGEVAALGGTLKKLDAVVGGVTDAKAAVIYDWENRWAIDSEAGPQNQHKAYEHTCRQWHRPLWQRGVTVDVNDMVQDLSPYQLVIAPMLYMLRPGVAERLESFVQRGGTLVTTYFTGMVDQSDLCFLGGFPGPLRKLLGIWAEETDALPEGATQSVEATAKGAAFGLSGSYQAMHFADLVHVEAATCEVLATYGSDFYQGRPAATVNRVGKGRAIHIAARTEQRLLDDVANKLIDSLALPTALKTTPPTGVSVQRRGEGKDAHLFLMNFSEREQKVTLDAGNYVDIETSAKHTKIVALPAYASFVLLHE